MLQRGIELIQMLRADLQHLGARDLHELLRCWELWHRTWVGEAHMRHLLYRQETRWPGYYYRADYPKLDDTHWRVFVNSRYDRMRDTWALVTKPYINLVP
jgi:adenylylsulfate reductase subunit A